MKKSQIIVLVLFVTIILAGCTNNQDKQIQEQNDLIEQQNTLLQQQLDQQDSNTDEPGYVTDTNTTVNPNITGSIKTIPFEAVLPANNYSNNAF